MKQIKPRINVAPNQVQLFRNILGDENRMTQILLNFLSNAFKLTPKNGDIEVELKIIDDKEQKTSISDEHSEPVIP